MEPIEYEDQTCAYDYDCPFETESECATWYKKPVFKTTILPRAPHINPVRMNEMLYALHSNYNISANDSVMSPLLTRYKMLMRASNACCGAGIMYKMRMNGATDNDIYEFLKNNANTFAITSRCMVMNDGEIMSEYSNGVTGQMLADVRNACLCKNREWFENLLHPFIDLYKNVPQFASAPFTYTYTESMQRNVTVNINNDVQNTLGLMSVCPK